MAVNFLVKRLREGVDPNDPLDAEKAMDAAADEIERLRKALDVSSSDCAEAFAENERLRDECEIQRKGAGSFAESYVKACEQIRILEGKLNGRIASTEV